MEPLNDLNELTKIFEIPEFLSDYIPLIDTGGILDTKDLKQVFQNVVNTIEEKKKSEKEKKIQRKNDLLKEYSNINQSNEIVFI
jgi:hypothetical protein